MKKFLKVSFVFVLLITTYLLVNFFLFDKWTLHQSEHQLNSDIENHNTNHLKQISKDKKTYKFLKNEKKINIVSQSDNQGSGNINYYRVTIHNHSGEIYINANHDFIPKKPTIESIRML
ncbi:hypothetical protein [Mammaliicoccus vitulinus]|uniref:hypothetical protein n=1 Tax=Mammaliicoccus vitulinus TaxID=71237 RepID=UPI003BA1D72C